MVQTSSALRDGEMKMEENHEPRTGAVAYVESSENPNPEVGKNSQKSREEGELYSSDDDDELPAVSTSQFDTTAETQDNIFPVALINKGEAVKRERQVASSNPKFFVDKVPKNSALPNYQKSTEKNRAPFVPFVISFSDDDSGSDSEEFRQPKAPEIKGNTYTPVVEGNRRLHSSSVTKSHLSQSTTRNKSRVIPRKVPLSRTFVPSITKISGANSKNRAHSSLELRSRDRKFATLNKKPVGLENGGNQNMHLNSNELQDLRQQIAIREKELKLKSVQQNGGTVSGSSRDHILAESSNGGARKCRATSADSILFEAKEPDKKRLKVNEPYPTRKISDIQKQKPPVKTVFPFEKSVLETGGQRSINEHSYHDKAIPLVTMHTRAVQLKRLDDAQNDLSQGNQSAGFKGADTIVKGSQNDKHIKPVDPSVSFGQMERAGNRTAVAHDKQCTKELMHSCGFNCCCTQMSNEASYRRNLTAGGEIQEAAPVDKAFKPTLEDKHQVSHNNSSICNCLGMVSSSPDNSKDMQSLLEIEELQEKELEEAQEHRRKCEIEERNALKAYRRAQRALVEANARCSLLYQKREIYSAHFRSLLVENSSSFWSSRVYNCTGPALNSSNNMSEENVHQLPTSSHQMQSKYGTYNHQVHHSDIPAADSALQMVSDQRTDGQDLPSDPCSEPDASTSDPHKDNRMADGDLSLSSDLNAIADDEEVDPFDCKSVYSSLDCPRKDENSAERAKNPENGMKRKFSFDTSQDSLLLEATLRSQLFAKLESKTLSKGSGPTHDVHPAAVTGAEEGGASMQEKSIPEIPVQTNNDGCIENLSSNCVSPIADRLDSGFCTEANQSSRFIISSCLILRSAFAHLKVTEPISLVEFQKRNERIHNADICNEDGISVSSTEIQSKIFSPESSDGNLMDICSGEIGCFTSNPTVNPFWSLCMFELRGKCNNDECPWQHIKDYSSKNTNSDSRECQVGSLKDRRKFFRETNIFKGFDCFDLAPPTYFVCLDMLKADLRPRDSILARTIGLSWQKCFSSFLVLSSLLPSHFSTDEPFLHGAEARIDVYRSWDRQSLYLHSRNGTMGECDQQYADIEETLEMALLCFNQEGNKINGRIEALKVLARTLEANPTSIVLWAVYLHIYYSNEESIGEDDMFFYAVEYNEGSYELWLMYINSRMQLEDRVNAFDTALVALCRHASATGTDAVNASACILDLFLQLVNFLCISGNIGKAMEKLSGLFPSVTSSDEPHSLLLSDVLSCLTLHDKVIFWICCVYFMVYRKLPDAIVQQLECEKELFGVEWPSAHLTLDEKQQAIKLMEVAVDSLVPFTDSEGIESETTSEAAHMFALNHIRCMVVLEGLDSSRKLLDKYAKLYPSCLELVLMSARMKEDDYEGSTFVGFEEALSNWPDDVPGVQCIWNQYAECALHSGRIDFVKDLMNRWFYSVWQRQHSGWDLDSVDEKDSFGLPCLAAESDTDTSVSNSSKVDAVFGLINLSLHKLLQNDLPKARLAIDRALTTAPTGHYMHCVREHTIFLLANGSQFNNGSCPNDEILSILKSYMADTRALPASKPLSRKFIEGIKKTRVRQIVGKIWSPVSTDFSLVNSILELWYGPSLLPQMFGKLNSLVDLVEALMEIAPSNYKLAISVCKLLSSQSNPGYVVPSNVLFWASSLLVNALFQAVPVAAESVWVEAAGILCNLTNIQSISESFHRRALYVYPFSVKLWKSHLKLSRVAGNMNSVREAAKERGIELD
ncbi:hypothetical protein NMG60_11012493 [Bertholletia excelsa]